MEGWEIMVEGQVVVSPHGSQENWGILYRCSSSRSSFRWILQPLEFLLTTVNKYIKSRFC